MEAFQNIQLSFKCPKALDDLQPCQSNWYCDGCQKMVYDFRGMEEAQILQAFAQSGQKLCGIYDANRINILPQQSKWFRPTWAAVMALGMTILNGCGFGEKKPKVITLAGVILPPIHNTMGKMRIDTPKYHHKIKGKKSKDPGQKVSLGIPEIGKKPIIDTGKNNNAFVGAVEINPEFPGGEEAFAKFIHEHLKTKGEYCYQGKVYVQFVVEKDGSLSDLKVVKGGLDKLNEQIVEVFKQSPKWRSGIQNGKVTKVQYIIPVNLIPTE